MEARRLGSVAWSTVLSGKGCLSNRHKYLHRLDIYSRNQRGQSLRLQRADLFNGLFGDLQDQEYEWDELGNLLERYDYSGDKSLREDFGYDDLNRLKWSEVSGRERISLDYNAWGNITHKSDVGDYRYGAECQEGAGPHALCETSDGVRYWYDANGSMVGDSTGRRIEYSSFDKPTEIRKDGHTTRFAYNPSRSRYLRTDENAQGDITRTRYLGNVERITHPDGRLEIKRRLPGGALISYSRSADGQPAGKTTHYLHKDHLGSVDTISDETGQLVAQMSFDPWGQRRNPLNWGALVDKALSEFDPGITDITKRGFTGHEMLDEVGLIHMNGRIYDPRLGRFLQADPLIDGVTDTQGYNRYSYVHNNPLNATDPSGFSAWTRFRDNILKPVIQGIVTWACIPCGAALAAATTLYYGGSVGDAAIAAFSTFAMATVGTNIGGPGGAGFGFNLETLGFATLGGITSALRGGKFGHGFVSAGAGSVAGAKLGPVFNKGGLLGKVIGGAVVGGTLTKITGGKFANGAAYGAFAVVVQEGANRAIELDPNGDPYAEGPFDTAEDTGYGLDLVDEKLTGEIRFGCNTGEMAVCKKAIAYMDQVVSENEFLDIENVLVTDKSYEVFIASDPSVHTAHYNSLHNSIRFNTIKVNLSDVAFKRVFQHEYGHVIGLSHSQNPSKNFMSYYGLGKDFKNVEPNLSNEQIQNLTNAYKPWYQIW